MNSNTLPAAEILMEEACQATGLKDFGPSEWFLEPLRIELDSINSEARLNESGAAVQRQRLVGALSNRLRLFQAIRKNPEIATWPIEVKGVLLALSRSGTTMLHRLLNATPKLERLF